MSDTELVTPAMPKHLGFLALLDDSHHPISVLASCSSLEVPRTAGLGTEGMYSLAHLEVDAGNPMSTVPCLSEGSWGESAPCFLLVSGHLGVRWLVAATFQSLSLSPQDIPPASLCLFFPYKETSHIGSRSYSDCDLLLTSLHLQRPYSHVKSVMGPGG